MVKSYKSPCQLLHRLQTTPTMGFFLPKPTPRGALTHPQHPEPSCLTSALQMQPPASPRSAEYLPFPPWLGAGPGCPGAAGAGAGGCSSFLLPLFALKCFWLQFGNEDLHEAKPIRRPLCGSRACLWVGLKREGKEEAWQFAGRRKAEKTLGIASVWEGSEWWHSQGHSSSRDGAGQV